MSIRLDPRRLAALKLLAAEAGVRPGELVTRWVEERLDAARGGGTIAPTSAAPVAPDALSELRRRLEAVEQRLDALPAARAVGAVLADEPATPQPEAPRRRGRPPKDPNARKPSKAPKKRAGGAPRIPLHEEIAAVIGERGPMTAAELASAIAERGRYAAPRSSRPLDAATVNSRVSNPAYRSRFIRREGRIDLAPTS
jgi:hypothetical protein